jgi:pimeloyl-ACP methyl ester carboxylesterase
VDLTGAGPEPGLTGRGPVWPPEVQHARVNGVNLPYLDQGHGVPVVFVHGIPGDHRAWEDQREAVAERYRFIAPTLRYCGTGPWPDDGDAFSMATHADDLAAFIRQLRGGPAHVVGWSYGGAIGILLAVHHPEWVKSLFVFEPGLATFVTDPADAQLAGEDRTDMRAPAAMAIEAGDTRVAVRHLMDGVMGQPGTFEGLAPVIRSSMLDNARTLRLSLRPPPPPPITCAQLGQITVALARAELARPFCRIVTEAHRCIRGSRLIVIRGGGHLAPANHAAAFNEALLSFLTTL